MAKLGKTKNKDQHKAHVAKKSGVKGSAFKRGNASTNPNRPASKKQTHLRTKATINRLNMYRKKADPVKMKAAPKVPMVRIQPDRRWFGNTRVLAQNKLQAFREEMSKSVDDPFNVVLKASKLPMTLLQDSEKESRMNLLQVETFQSTFGKKSLRKKPKVSATSMAELLSASEAKGDKYDDKKDTQLRKEEEERTWGSEYVFHKGTSKRIWGELYKVVDSSDVVIEVIDARDPMGTRNTRFEKEMKKNHPHKKLVLLLNKVDLIPAWAAAKWTRVLSKEYPTVAFHASVTNAFGKGPLIQLLRQFAVMLKQRQHVSIGLIGYPNVGKSSVINALKMKKVCKAAPVPGETKCWQFVSLTRRIFLIDCPGIVPPTAEDFAADSAKVLRGVVRAERIEYPSNYVPEVLDRVKHSYILKRYNLPEDTKPWEDHEEFLSFLARKMGKLFKGGEPDMETCARTVLYDWQRGRLPFFVAPPDVEGGREKTQKFAKLRCELGYDAEDANREAINDDSDEEVEEEDDAEEAEAAEDAEPAEESEEEAPPVQKRIKKKVQEKPKVAKKGKKAGKKAKAAQAPAVNSSLDWDAIGKEFAA